MADLERCPGCGGVLSFIGRAHLCSGHLLQPVSPERTREPKRAVRSGGTEKAERKPDLNERTEVRERLPLSDALKKRKQEHAQRAAEEAQCADGCAAGAPASDQEDHPGAAMTWFKHKHRWRRTSEMQRVHTKPDAKDPEWCFYVEQCRCGVVRVIELRPGEDPVIRNAVEGR